MLDAGTSYTPSDADLMAQMAQVDDFRPPRFHELITYQFHVGVFYARDAQGQDVRSSVGKLLKVAERVPYLADLGVNAIQPLPFVEFCTEKQNPQASRFPPMAWSCSHAP